MKKRDRLRRRAAAHAAGAAQEEARGVAHAGAESAQRATVRPGGALRRGGAFWRGGAIWRGVVLDLTVVASHLFLLAPLARVLREGGQGFLLPDAEDSVAGLVSPRVGWLFLSAFAAHAAGAYLKRLPRAARLAARVGARHSEAEAESRPTSKPVVIAACALLLGHFFIFMSLLFSGWQSTWLERWSPLFGRAGAENTYTALFVRFVLIVFVMPLPTALVVFNLGGASGVATTDAPSLTDWRTHWATELVADLLLYFSIIIVTLVMNVLIAPRFASDTGPGDLSAGDALASLIPMALAFSLLYLPPRLVYLAEDYRRPLAWATILLALLSLAYRTFSPGPSW